MRHCKHCNVNLPGLQNRCPLCGGAPTGEPDDTHNPYPAELTPPKRINPVLIAWIALGSICGGAVCVAVNIATAVGGWWCLFVVAGIVCFWLDFLIVLKKRSNLPKTIIWQVIVISVMAFLWDLATVYRGWSLDYVLPILSAASMLALTMVAKVQRLNIQDYILYLVIACVFGTISFILLLIGPVHAVLPSVLSLLSTIVFLSFLLFFEGKALWAECKRRLHL